jgi:hypothetical protein
MTAYDAIRKIVVARVGRITPATEAQLDNLSLGALLNLLFLLRGEWGSIGDYSQTYSALVALLGENTVWHVPAEVKDLVH